MRDPKPVPADSGDPQTPHTPVVPAVSGDDYQFASRRDRKVHELTGMIPVVAPARPDTGKPAAPIVLQQRPATAEPAQKLPAPVPAQELPAPVPAQELPAPVPVALAAGVPAAAERPVPTRGPVPAVAVTGIPVMPLAADARESLPDAVAKLPRTPKAGRDLPAAIGVGIALLFVVLGSMVFFPLAFVVLATVAAGVGVWEVSRALHGRGIHVPQTPVMIGTLAMPASAYFGGPEGLLFALVASCGATLLWRSLDPELGTLKSIMAGIFTLLWVPFLLSFVFLMLQAERGPTLGLTLDVTDLNAGVLQVTIMLALVVANDTFGYLVGVFFGKHPMAPQISPKKSWEGFAGSLIGATVVAILAAVFLLGLPWWVGLILAIGMVIAGTGGDFAESMVKRELGVKDMSNILPGHGGVMDRLDSIVFAAPVAYAIFTVLGKF